MTEIARATVSVEEAAKRAELEDALGGARHVQSEMDARIAELEAERDKWRNQFMATYEKQEWLQAMRDSLAIHLSDARARIAELEAEIARLTAALATMEEAAVRNGVALQAEAREAERDTYSRVIDTLAADNRRLAAERDRLQERLQALSDAEGALS